MDFWELCTKPNSSIDCLDSKNPLHRHQILQALEDLATCGEWLDPGHQAMLYGLEEGVVIYVRDVALRLLLETFFESSKNKERLSKAKTPL